MRHRKRPLLLAASLACAVLAACCTPPSPAPDFSTPEATLATFQGAFRADDPFLEYECFSGGFKEENGHFDSEMYTFARETAIAENPLLKAFFALDDLTDNIESREVDLENRRAEIVLSVLGEEFRIEFVRETFYTLEFDGDSRIREDLMPPLRHAVRREEGGLLIAVPVRIRGWLRNVPDLHRIELEEQWKFESIDFLNGESASPPQP